MEFRRLDQTRFRSKSSIIADQILQMIRCGELNAGEKLPPERIIAEQLGVSRPSVREAISALQIVGILETRPGDGTYVTRSSAMDELTQPLSGRTCDVNDWFADLAGAAAGVAVFWLVSTIRHGNRVTHRR